MADSQPVDRSERLENWRKRCFLGELPTNFLVARTSGSSSSSGRPAAGQGPGIQPLAMPSAYQGYPYATHASSFGNIQGYLKITVNQARLSKNYGFTKMDPYCRLRVGHAVLETRTAYNGSKNPHWNQVLHCQLPRGIKKLDLEVYNERSFAPDSRIAWGYFEFPEDLLQGETVDEWVALSGQQGDEKEGVLNLTITYMQAQGPVVSPGPMTQVMSPPGMPTSQVYQHGGYPPNYQQPVPPPQPRPPQAPQISEQSLKQLKEMFPDMDEEVFKSVLASNGGSVERSINQLLTMT